MLTVGMHEHISPIVNSMTLITVLVLVSLMQSQNHNLRSGNKQGNPPSGILSVQIRNDENDPPYRNSNGNAPNTHYQYNLHLLLKW